MYEKGVYEKKFLLWRNVTNGNKIIIINKKKLPNVKILKRYAITELISRLKFHLDASLKLY